jgi:FkbM family methyltransferase
MPDYTTYLDLGAHDGDSIRQMIRRFPSITDVHAFEPSPGYDDKWKVLQDEFPEVRIHFLRSAAWLYDGHIVLNVYPDIAHWVGLSNTILPQNRHFGVGVKLTVPCLDFSRWLANLQQENVLLKLDVEGAEYDLLDKLIADGTISKVGKLYVEFHDWLMPDEYKARHKSIWDRCPLYLWNA